MTTVTATGYLDGIAYTLIADTEQNNDTRGIVTQASPGVLAAIEAVTGQESHRYATGRPVPAGLDAVDGLRAALTLATEVVSLTGDDGADLLGPSPEDTPTEPVVH